MESRPLQTFDHQSQRFIRLRTKTARAISDKSENMLARSLWKKYGKNEESLAVVLYPDKASELRNHVAHVCPLDENSLSQIATSPTRSAIGKRLTEGHSAVWILLESGDSSKDQAAKKTLEAQLAKDQEWLKLPSAEELEIAPALLKNAKIQLKIEFSLLTVKRNDPQESFLVNALLNSEPDLRDFDEPIAFPVFGRGIVLYALVGKGIGADTIRNASSFIVGPCSCQVKEQNPGFDLLLPLNWTEALGEHLISPASPGSNIPSSNTEPKILKIAPGRTSK
jgi:hypothetical protein